MTRKSYVVGDIHGGLKALKQIFSKVAVYEDDTVIFLGDYVDGWSESAQTIDYLITIGERHNCVFIKGNHDVYLLNWLKKDEMDETWLNHGGIATIQSYSNYSNEQKEIHINFLERLINYYEDDDGRLFIHAGFTSMHGPNHEFVESYYHWDRTLWEVARTMDKHIQKDSKLYPKRLLIYDEIYIGHTPTINYDVAIPMQCCNVWNVDTGAGFYGPLTIMDVDTKRFFQSDILPSLYQDEKGRNG